MTRGLLPPGTDLDNLGVIVRSSDTAYLVEDQIGVYWVSHDRVHGTPVPVVPLVELDQ